MRVAERSEPQSEPFVVQARLDGVARREPGQMTGWSISTALNTSSSGNPDTGRGQARIDPSI